MSASIFCAINNVMVANVLHAKYNPLLALLKSFLRSAIWVAIFRNADRSSGWLNSPHYGDLWVQITLTGWAE